MTDDRARLRAWLEGRAQAYRLDADYSEAHPPVPLAEWRPPWPGAPKPSAPSIDPEVRRLVADELDYIAQGLEEAS